MKRAVNRFYGDFDVECWEKERREDYRTPFQIDRDRIVHTSAFRRLQGKTQVFWSGEYDFYRTRLTHSLEVAQIGKAIASWLLASSDDLAADFCIDLDLVEAICLSHDIGHAPFGHAGERVLNEILADLGGYEGNAQTLRLLTDTIYRHGEIRAGMRPTRAFADGVLKYKALRSELIASGIPTPENHFLYDEQGVVREFVLGGARPAEGMDPGTWNDLKSVECQIMDWADDTAYSLHDLADGIRAGFLTATKIERWADGQELSSDGARAIEEWLGAIREDRIDVLAGRKISEFIRATRLERRTGVLADRSHRHAFRLEVAAPVRRERGTLGELARDLIYESPQVHQLEWKARHMLRGLFEAFAATYLGSHGGPGRLHLLPPTFERLIAAEPEPAGRARRIADYIAGMTDGFASRTYKRLFDPEFGSIVDLV